MHHLDLGEISGFDHHFDIFCDSFEPDEELVAFGLHPPIVIARSSFRTNSDYSVVWGFQYLRAASASGTKKLVCREVEGGAAKLLGIALKLENRKDRYSWKERESLASLVKELDIDPSSDDIVRLVQSSGSFVPQVAQYRGLPEILQEAISNRRLELKTALRVKGLPKKAFDKILTLPGLTVSNLRQLLTLLEEIRRKNQFSDEELMSTLDAALELSDSVSALRRVRYPELTDMEREFRDIESRVLKKSGITLTAPAGFEGSSFTAAFSFKNGSDIDSAIEALDSLRRGGDELFALLQ